MKKLIKLLVLLMLLRYGGDIARDIDIRLPSYEELKAFAVHMSHAVSNYLEASGVQPSGND